MERVLIFIKHNLQFLWKIIEYFNGIIFHYLFKSKLVLVQNKVLEENKLQPFTFRRIQRADIESLHKLISMQDPSDLKFFNPHAFDIKSLFGQLNNHAFLMMGVFMGDAMVGYFFLRFFINKKCFVGRLIDKPYRGQGIGIKMNDIMYSISWKMNFRCLSTISKDNIPVMKAHSKNPTIKLLGELDNNYLLVEFVKR